MSKKHAANPKPSPKPGPAPDPTAVIDELLGDASEPAAVDADVQAKREAYAAKLAEAKTALEDHPDGEAMAEVKKALDDAPVPDAPIPDDRPVGEIIEAPPEGEGTPAFRMLDAGDIDAFPPPEPLPPLPVIPGPTPDHPVRQGVFPTAPPSSILTSEQPSRMGADDPNVVVTTTPEPPAPPAFDHLPERTRLELAAGRAAVGGKIPLAEAVRAAAPSQPTSNTPLPPPAVEEEKEPDWSSLPERTRIELAAGREALRRRDADYRETLRRVDEANRQRLTENAPAHADDLSYSEKR